MRVVVALMVMLAACAEETNLPLGTSCDENDECASGLCQAAAIPHAQRVCMCAQDSDCGQPGLVCKLSLDAGRFCTAPW